MCLLFMCVFAPTSILCYDKTGSVNMVLDSHWRSSRLKKALASKILCISVLIALPYIREVLEVAKFENKMNDEQLFDLKRNYDDHKFR